MANRVVLHPGEIAAVADDPALLEELRPAVEALVREFQAAAPRDTGAGAASIHAEIVDGEWRIGWDPEHDYLRYHELGSSKEAARPFIRPTADRLRN